MKIINKNIYDGEEYLLEYEDSDDFSNLPIELCKQVYGVCFCGDNIVIVFNGDKKHWGLPGGGVEFNETLGDCLVREIKEETNMLVIHHQPIGFQKVTNKNGKVGYQLRSMCIVKPYGKFIEDPDCDVTKIKLINPKEYKKYFDWKEIGDRIIERGIELRNNYKFNSMIQNTTPNTNDSFRPLLEAHRLFVDEQLARENMSKTTRRGYSYDILEFINDYNKNSTNKLKNTNQLSIKLVNDYFIKLDALNKKGSTRHRKVAALKKFIKFLESNNWVPSNISDSIIWPKIEEDEPRPLSENQYKAFLRETGVSIRDHAMFELLMQTGIRLSEMTSLTIENIFIPKVPSQDHVTGVGHIRVKRKGNKVQELALSYKACKVIKEYLKIRPKAEEERLFLTKYGKPISNRGVQWLFKKYAKLAGLPDWAHVHTLRTTNFTYKLAKGVDVRTVQHNAGHKNIATTSRYLAYVKEAGIKSAQDMPL